MAVYGRSALQLVHVLKISRMSVAAENIAKQVQVDPAEVKQKLEKPKANTK